MKEMRKFPRLTAPHPIELIYCGRRYLGRLENLSLNGALVWVEEQVEIATGRGCELRIELPVEGEVSTPLRLGAETIHVSSSLIGMRFTGCDQETGSSLELLVQRLAARPDRVGYDLARIRDYLADYRNQLR